MVDVGAFEDGDVVGEELDGDGIEERRHEGVAGRHLDAVEELAAEAREALLVGDHHHLAAARQHLLDVGAGLLEEVVARRQHDHRRLLVDERDRPVLHLAGGIALGVDVGDLLELERALERQREAGAAAEIEHVARLGDLRRDLLDRLVMLQHLVGLAPAPP